MFAATGRADGNGLRREVDAHLRCGVFLDFGKQMVEEILADGNGQHEVVELVVFMDVGKEA